jgi:endoglycosylceramidase
VFFTGSCKKENANVSYIEDPSIFQDQYGRQLILHGLNTISKNPAVNYQFLEVLETDVEKQDKEYGFNFVRYGIIWDGIEPQKDSFDDTYLDKVEERVNWHTSRGMYVMLDMHQDLYSFEFGGDGAPAWAIQANGHPVNSDNASGVNWQLKYYDPAVIAAEQNFWQYTRYKELQDHYILSWQKVAERFKNNPYVIGYDLMNEPNSGNPVEDALGIFEKKLLKDFYNRLIPALRSIDNEKYLIFEPVAGSVVGGLPSGLPKINDTRSSPRLGYSPHLYAAFSLAASGPYAPFDKLQVTLWKLNRTKEIKMQNCPMIIGEFGLDRIHPGFDDYLDDVLNIADELKGGWAYWANGFGLDWSPFNPDRSLSPIGEQLVRTYPKAVQGKINSFSFDRISKNFALTYHANVAISQPTEIFVPVRHYPSGYNLSISGTNNYTQEYDAARQMLKLWINEQAIVNIIITPK